MRNLYIYIYIYFRWNKQQLLQFRLIERERESTFPTLEVVIFIDSFALFGESRKVSSLCLSMQPKSMQPRSIAADKEISELEQSNQMKQCSVM